MLNVERMGAGQSDIGPREVADQSKALIAAPVSPPGRERETGLFKGFMAIY